METRPSTFGQRLRYLRLDRGFKQTELAASIDKPQSSISSYEADERAPTLPTLQALAIALGCSVAVLIGEDSYEDLPAISWPQQLLELNGYISQLPPLDLEELLVTMRVLVALKLDRAHKHRRKGQLRLLDHEPT